MNPMYGRLIDKNGNYADPTYVEAVKKIHKEKPYTIRFDEFGNKSCEFTATNRKGVKTGVIRYY